MVEQQDNFNLEDTSITKLRVINVKNIYTIKTENIPVTFIDSSINFILDETRNSQEKLYLKEISAEKMFMYNYYDTFKSVKSDNKKEDAVVQNVNNESIKLQEEVLETKQLQMKL